MTLGYAIFHGKSEKSKYNNYITVKSIRLRWSRRRRRRHFRRRRRRTDGRTDGGRWRGHRNEDVGFSRLF